MSSRSVFCSDLHGFVNSSITEKNVSSACLGTPLNSQGDFSSFTA